MLSELTKVEVRGAKKSLALFSGPLTFFVRADFWEFSAEKKSVFCFLGAELLGFEVSSFKKKKNWGVETLKRQK